MYAQLVLRLAAIAGLVLGAGCNSTSMERQLSVNAGQPTTQPPPAASSNLSQGCLPAASFEDPDVRRNIARLGGARFCLSRDNFAEGGFNWDFTIIRNQTRPVGPLWVVTHDDEDAAFDTAVYGVQRYGGVVVAMNNAENRTNAGQDPNRSFGGANKSASCRQQRAASPLFTARVLQLRPSGAPIIALHTNDNGYDGDGKGGSGTISVNRTSSVLTPFPATQASPLADEDNVLLLAGSEPAPGSAAAKALTAKMTQASGVNVIYEHVTAASNDCSLSNHVVLDNLGAYYNIEVEHGRGVEQQKILDILMGSLR